MTNLNMDKEILECVLKKNSKDSTIEKIISVDIVSAVGKFVNFLSNVNRINLKVILKNGRTTKKSLFMKILPSEGPLKDFSESTSIFKTEINMYGMLKEIEYLMEEYQDSDNILWCKMIYYIPYNLIILEDLKALGFYMLEREDLFDLEHSMLAAHSLGKYHGLCKKQEERGILSSQGYNPWYIFSDALHKFMYWDLVSLTEGIKKLWDLTWIPFIEKINMSKESLSQRLQKLSEFDETKFNVLNHGDPHKNNIVFKYDSDKRPIALRFFDFQLVHYGSPCLDLTYMLYLGCQPSVRRDNVDLLIRTYHNSLSNTLDKYEFKGNKPSIEEILDGMEKYSFIGTLLFITRYPNLLVSERLYELRDPKKIEATDGKEGWPDEIYKPSSNLVDNIGPDLITFSKMFL